MSTEQQTRDAKASWLSKESDERVIGRYAECAFCAGVEQAESEHTPPGNVERDCPDCGAPAGMPPAGPCSDHDSQIDDLSEQEREAMERGWQQQRLNGDHGEEDAYREGWLAHRSYAREERCGRHRGERTAVVAVERLGKALLYEGQEKELPLHIVHWEQLDDEQRQRYRDRADRLLRAALGQQEDSRCESRRSGT